MKCKYCGTDIPEDVKFCPECGAKIAVSEESDDEKADYEYGHDNTDSGAYDYVRNMEYSGSNREVSAIPYIIFSILVTICCCIPLGIAGIVYAIKINKLNSEGNYEGARSAAKKAQICLIVGSVAGFVVSLGFGAFSIAESGGLNSYIEESQKILKEEFYDYEDDYDDVPVEEEEPKVVENKNPEDWSNFVIEIQDEIFTLPCTVNELGTVGFEMEKEDIIVDDDDYELVFFNDEKEHTLLVMMLNDTEEELPAKDCIVAGVYVTAEDVGDDLNVVLPGGIKIGSTIDEVIGKWGEEYDVKESVDGDVYTWYEKGTYNYCSVTVDPVEKKVIVIDLDGQSLEKTFEKS